MAEVVKDVFEHFPPVPDLGGQVTISNYKPVYTGPYSCIYRGELKKGGEMIQVAIKVLSEVCAHSTDRDAAQRVMLRKLERERRAWGALSHPNIVPLYGFANDEDLFKPYGALISPWFEKGDAERFLAEHGPSMSVQERMNLWKGVVSGVAYLHSFNPVLIHGDLKPRNILINEPGNAQICDFGLVRIFLDEGSSGMTTTSLHTGTERYLAHELVVGGDEAHPTAASDIYAVGCIGLEFLFLQIPYSWRKNNLRGSIFRDIKAGKRPGELPANLSPSLESMWAKLELCWNMDPVRRPSAPTLLKWMDESVTIRHSAEHFRNLARIDREEAELNDAIDEMDIDLPMQDDLGTGPTPQRRRSKSDPSALGHGPPSQESTLFSGYPPGHMYAGSSMHLQSFATNYNVNNNSTLGEDVVLGDASGANLMGTKSLPIAHPPTPHHRRAPTVVPTVAVTDWSHVQSGHAIHPSDPLHGMSQSYHGQGNDAIHVHMDYGTQGVSAMYAQSGHQTGHDPTTFMDNNPYPPPNMTNQLAVAGPSSLARASSMKQKQQGQRTEVDRQNLQAAFNPGSYKHDPALRFLLDLILDSRFYTEDEHEPLLGSPEAEQILTHLRNVYPHDMRFAWKNDGGYESRAADDTEAREPHSIFMLFTENNQCLICGQQKDRAGRALGHVRSDIGHRPYHCTCEKCRQSPNPRRFFSDNLLGDHIKGQTQKQQCPLCLNWFRRGGMKRHMSSKHPDKSPESMSIMELKREFERGKMELEDESK